MTIWVCQCLCPDRHCILAAAGEAGTEAEAQTLVRTPLRRQVMEFLRDQAINPACAICGANRATWRYELRRTKYTTMEQAEPALRDLEMANLATNRLWGDIHKTSRPN